MIDLTYSLEEQEIEERRLEILRKLKHRRLNEPYRYYQPIGKFEEFIGEVAKNENSIFLFEAANGVGKTFGMANMLANLFWRSENKYFDYPFFKAWPYKKTGRIISYPNAIAETIIPTLKAVFPKGRFNYESKYLTTKEGKRYESHWITDTGWTFQLMTYDQAVEEFESANLGFFWADEPPSIQIFRANYSRLRMGGMGFITETPLKGSQWIYDEFINKSPDARKEEKKVVVTASLEDACSSHGVNGFLPHDQIVKQVAGYDKDELQSRVFGKHSHLSGLVFKKWNEDVHIIEPFNISFKDYVVVHALDPHPRVNDAGLWIAIDRHGRYFKIHELWGSFETGELAARIKAINSNYRVVKMLIDPSAFVVDKHTGYQLAADLRENYKLDYEPGSKAREAAIDKIMEFIDYQRDENGMIIPPRLRSFRTCEQANWEMGRYMWQDWRGLTAQFKNPKEKPVDKDDHMIEDLGRIILADVQFEEVEKEIIIPQWAQGRPQTQSSARLDPYA